MRSILVLAVLLAAAAAQLQDPEDLALELDEEAFEDYLDAWLEQEQSRLPNQDPPSSGGCTFQINKKSNDKDLGQPQPVFLRSNWYLASYGNTGQIRLNKGDKVTLACTGPGKLHYPKGSDKTQVAEAECVKNNLVSGRAWLNGNVAFGKLTCTAHSTPVVQKAKGKCWNGNTLIAVGFNVNQVFYPLYLSCFDEQRMEALYVRHVQTPENTVHQTGVSRPTWQADSVYPGVDLGTIYTQVSQKAMLARYVGEDLAKRYITKTKTRFFARGHLAAKSDFVFATAQRSTFYFFNAAPQWQCINAGNWNRLEQNLRARIGAAGYNTVIYTGTFGVLQLPDKNNKLVDIYLAQGKIPVPRFYYKVVYDEGKGKGTAFITINNPHITPAEAEATAREFCDCHCRRRSEDFNWLKWDLNRIDVGYSFCCTVEEFRIKIKHLPPFATTGLLV